MSATWEVVHDNKHEPSGWEDLTERLRVPGGWLYRTIRDSSNESMMMALVFVPDREGQP